MKHTLSVLVENKFGVLARVASLFSARGYNIDSLAVSETQDPTLSRMTIVVNASDEQVLDQIKKQLNKLIDIVTVTDFTKKEYIERELVFVKVIVAKNQRAKFKKIVDRMRGRIVEKGAGAMIVEIVADQDHIRRLLDELKDFKLVELVKSGRIAIAK